MVNIPSIYGKFGDGRSYCFTDIFWDFTAVKNPKTPGIFQPKREPHELILCHIIFPNHLLGRFQTPTKNSGPFSASFHSRNSATHPLKTKRVSQEASAVAARWPAKDLMLLRVRLARFPIPRYAFFFIIVHLCIHVCVWKWGIPLNGCFNGENGYNPMDFGVHNFQTKPHVYIYIHIYICIPTYTYIYIYT